MSQSPPPPPPLHVFVLFTTVPTTTLTNTWCSYLTITQTLRYIFVFNTQRNVKYLQFWITKLCEYEDLLFGCFVFFTLFFFFSFFFPQAIYVYRLHFVFVIIDTIPDRGVTVFRWSSRKLNTSKQIWMYLCLQSVICLNHLDVGFCKNPLLRRWGFDLQRHVLWMQSKDNFPEGLAVFNFSVYL